MRRAVLADGQTAVRTDNLDIETRICDRVAHLLISAAGGEHGEGIGKRHLAAGGQTGSNADHIGLSDTDVKKLVGKRLGKAVGHCCTGQISIQYNQLWILTKFHERLTISGTRSNDFSHH